MQQTNQSRLMSVSSGIKLDTINSVALQTPDYSSAGRR